MNKKALNCPPRTAVAYARYSSAGQRDVSIDQQLADIRAYAEREGFVLVHEYADHAKSGFRHVEQRTAFQAMISAAEKGRFDTILCWKVDRFGRSRADSAIYKKQLEKHGVSVRYVMENLPDGAAGFLTEGMLETIAEWYSRNLSENVKRGMNDNARKCLYNGMPFYGYSGVRGEKYTINEEQAAVVRQIFDLYVRGYSMMEILRQLGAAGILAENGKAFTINRIYNILSQERYLGIYIFGEYRIPGGMPAIIDEATWKKAQVMREKTGRHIEKNNVEFLLTGKAFCGHCGKPMIGDSGTSKTHTTYYYYSCQNHKNRTGCDKKSVRKDALEDFVIDFLMENVLSGPEMERIADAVYNHQQKEREASPLRAMQKELASVERKISNINDAIADGVWSASTAAKLKELESAAAKLQQSIVTTEYKESLFLDRDDILYFLTGFSRLDRKDPDNRRTLVRLFLNAVYVYDDHYRIIVNTSDESVTIPFADLPPEDDPGSSNVCRRVLRQIHSNSVLIEYIVKN